MATEADLITRVLGMLRAIGSGQSGNAEDVAKIQAYIQPKLDDLALREIAYFADSESVSDAALQWVAMAITQDMADDFGIQPDAGKIQLAEKRLRALEAVRSNGDPIKACYF